jgi:hypothetical protein
VNRPARAAATYTAYRAINAAMTTMATTRRKHSAAVMVIAEPTANASCFEPVICDR